MPPARKAQAEGAWEAEATMATAVAVAVNVRQEHPEDQVLFESFGGRAEAFP